LRNLVAGAVPNLKPERVTVVDESGKMLAAGAEGDDAGIAGDLAADRKAQMEERVRRAVKDVVEGVVGAGKARIQVNADIDLTRATDQKEPFEPDSKVVRPTTTSEEKANETNSGPDGTVGAAANVPGGQQTPGSAQSGSTSGHTEETTNYEISKTTRT